MVHIPGGIHPHQQRKFYLGQLEPIYSSDEQRHLKKFPELQSLRGRQPDVILPILGLLEVYLIYIKRLNHPDLNFNEKILPQIKEIVTITRSAIGHKINRSKQNSVFEIYGYDFMIDRNYKVWLIEVNTNPCIEETSSLLKTLVPRMLDDAFKLTIDQIFELQAHDTFFNVNNYRNNENMWKPLD